MTHCYHYGILCDVYETILHNDRMGYVNNKEMRGFRF